MTGQSPGRDRILFPLVAGRCPDVARRHYSYTNLEKYLVALLNPCLGKN